jgi:glucose/arabinose dehydrogenase
MDRRSDPTRHRQAGGASASRLVVVVASAIALLTSACGQIVENAPARAAPERIGQGRLQLLLVTDALVMPTAMGAMPGDPDTLFVTERQGRLRKIVNGLLDDEPVLDLTGRVVSAALEQGLLGLAFHPRYPADERVFVNYTDLNGDSVIASYTIPPEHYGSAPAEETVILRIRQPAHNHNGGQIAFGPDGYLYIGTGDGSNPGDRFKNAQNRRSLLGKLLRIDIDGGQPYTIPKDNPFVEDPDVSPEIWALGLRNPWRFSFDRETGDLYIADVGQTHYEEINVEPGTSTGGQNYGWPVHEALHCYEADTCEKVGYTQPVVELSHDEACSVIGGFVYHGSAAQMQGSYLFGDFCSGRIWRMWARDGRWSRELLLDDHGLMLTAFGEDGAGEFYVLDYHGTVYRLVFSDQP